MVHIRNLVSRVSFFVLVLVIVSGLVLVIDITGGTFQGGGARFNILSAPIFGASMPYHGTDNVLILQQQTDFSLYLPIVYGGGDSHSPPVGPFYGMEYVLIDDLELVSGLGIEVVLMDVAHDGPPESWLAYLDEAQRRGIRVIAWLWPEGWHWNGSAWQIDAQGRLFVQTVAGHPALWAVYGLHEPYWNGCSGCGYTTAEQQALYNAIKAIADVPIYSEVDSMAFWTAHGEETAFADGVCDYCGTWYYPFKRGGIYERDELIARLEADLEVARERAPNSKFVWIMQSFEQRYAPYYLRLPTAEEMRDLASIVYSEDVDGAMWYVWVFDSLYTDFLSNHPELHPVVREIYDDYVLTQR
jgi:hypothetical protein